MVIMRVARQPAQEISAERAAAFVQSGMWLEYGCISAQPDVFDLALAVRITELSDIKIRNCISLRP